jgi:hypothetical protein
MDRPETYLGDGLHASFDGQNIWLRTSNSKRRICLEPFVFKSLIEYRDQEVEKYERSFSGEA